MKEMVAKLFIQEYKIEHSSFVRLFENFYEHTYQNERCIRVVALDENRVVGFQSFFYWPYEFQGKQINAYQSGNSLVHPDYRGQGIFQKLLHHIDEFHEHLKVDCLMGFPIDVSVGSLLRNGWKNIFNLNWQVRPCSVFSILRKFDGQKLQKALGVIHEDLNTPEELSYSESIRLNVDFGFIQWRRNYSTSSNYFEFRYQRGQSNIVFELKINIRKRYIKELIIGRISCHSKDHSKLSEAIAALCRAVRKSGQISIISIGYNKAGDSALESALQKNRFKKIKNEIFFCVKPFKDKDTLLNAVNWQVYRGDIDTW